MSDRYITNGNMSDIVLTQDADRWRFVDGKGRTVRLSLIVPNSFASESDARDAADRVCLSVSANGRLIVGGPE